jgi:GT2 family glycosyltransferase/glycosyltransferase involved in cell wall biosynthesis
LSTTSDPGAVKVLFASCTVDLIPRIIERMRTVLPELPLVVVSEFPPPEGEWIPYHIYRGIDENLQLLRARLGGRTIRFAAVVFEKKKPYGPLRWMGFRAAPLRFAWFLPNGEHFTYRPHGLPTLARFYLWRTREYIHKQTRPGGGVYTVMWHFGHLDEFGNLIRSLQIRGRLRRLRRKVLYREALAAGVLTRWLRKSSPRRPLPPVGAPLADGITVVIPSRNGRELLAECLPSITGVNEIIVVDNGSDDGTAEFLAREFPQVQVEYSPVPLSFAAAVDCGIERAKFSHTALLNNDMVVEPRYFAALRDAFRAVPDLFCATAQIFMPEGQRREETGKAVMRRSLWSFPITCDMPVEGEDHTYVLYGSGGASLYDTRKLRALGGAAPVYEPAYVEDLDLGFNAWRLNWPTIFVAGARVLHRHRATTSRYYTETQLSLVLERNYLRFLARSVSDPALFGALWFEAVWRVNVDCLKRPEFMAVLREARKAPGWMELQPAAVLPEPEVLAIGGGAVSVFAGKKPRALPRVMVVSPYLPFPLSHGGAVRMFNLMRRAAREFDQILVSFADELEPVPRELLETTAEIVLVKRYGTHAVRDAGRPDVVEEFDSPAFRAALHQTVRKWQPGVAQLEFTQMAQYAADCAPARTLLVEHDITLDLYGQLLAQKEDWELRRQHERWIRFEQQAWEQVDRVVTMSDKDRDAVGRANAVVLRNGVDVERFAPSSDPPERARILFIGTFQHLPNVLALDFFLRESWPLLRDLNPTLHVIAGARAEYYLERYRDRAQPPLDQPGIELEGFVADVRPAYRRATVVIAPLLASAGTNIKIMEAMAMGKAIVSTSAGINGLNDLENGRDVIVADTGREFAWAIAGLIGFPEDRRAIEVRARQTVVKRYDWDVIARRQAELYRSLTTAGR